MDMEIELKLEDGETQEMASDISDPTERTLMDQLKEEVKSLQEDKVILEAVIAEKDAEIGMLRVALFAHRDCLITEKQLKDKKLAPHLEFIERIKGRTPRRLSTSCSNKVNNTTKSPLTNENEIVELHNTQGDQQDETNTHLFMECRSDDEDVSADHEELVIDHEDNLSEIPSDLNLSIENESPIRRNEESKPLDSPVRNSPDGSFKQNHDFESHERQSPIVRNEISKSPDSLVSKSPLKGLKRTFVLALPERQSSGADHEIVDPSLNHDCNRCGKTFESGHTLRRHMRVHAQEKLFKCPFCDLECTRYDSVRKHLRLFRCKKVTISLGYSCKLCEIDFNGMLKLLEHMTKHVSCKSCDYKKIFASIVQKPRQKTKSVVVEETLKHIHYEPVPSLNVILVDDE